MLCYCYRSFTTNCHVNGQTFNNKNVWYQIYQTAHHYNKTAARWLLQNVWLTDAYQAIASQINRVLLDITAQQTTARERVNILTMLSQSVWSQAFSKSAYLLINTDTCRSLKTDGTRTATETFLLTVLHI